MKYLLIILSLAMILTGCRKTDTDKANPERVSNVYRSDFINLPDNVNIASTDICIYDDRIYFVGYEIDEKTMNRRNVLYSIKLDGTDEKINYDIFDGIGFIREFAILSDGRMSFVVITNISDERRISQTISVDTYDKNLNKLYSFDPRVLYNYTYDFLYINRLVASSDDILYIANDSNCILAVTPKGEKLFEVECSEFISEMSATPDGKIFVSYSERYTYVFRYIDPQKKDFGDYVEMPMENLNNNYDDNLYFGDGYDYYYKNSIGIYGCNNDTEPTLLLDFINSDISPNSISDITILSPDKFVYQGRDYLTNKSQIAILTRIPIDEVVPKKIINMAYLNADIFILNNAVISFNRSSNEYRIVTHDYSQYDTKDNPNGGREKFNNDIASGNIADIIIMDTNTTNDYVNKELFIDLYEFMDDKNEILQCVRNVFETDGKLYRLPMSFTINEYVGKTSILGDEDSWTINDMIDIIEKYPDSHLTPFMSQSSLLNMFTIYGLHDYINYDNGTCDFENEEFINILKYIYGMKNEMFILNNQDYWQDQRSYFMDNTILMDTFSFSSFAQFVRVQMLFNNEEITVKGYPSKKSNGIRINSGSIYTISSKSNVKNGAWQFIEYMLSDDVQTSDNIFGFPVTEKALALKAKKEKALTYYYNDDGSWGSNITLLEGVEYTRGVVKNLTDDDIKFVYDLFNSIDGSVWIDETMINIAREEINIFLEGQKSAEETAKIIQNRIGIYISENY